MKTILASIILASGFFAAGCSSTCATKCDKADKACCASATCDSKKCDKACEGKKCDKAPCCATAKK